MAAVETEAPNLALSDVNIKWEKLDKTRFHLIGAILFTVQQGLLHPTTVVKTRMQVDLNGFGSTRLNGFQTFKQILNSNGIAGIFRGFGTSAIGALPGRVLALTSLEMCKEAVLKQSEKMEFSEAGRITVANGVAGLVSNVVSCAYYVPLDVICQRLMVQGLPGMRTFNGPVDVVRKVVRSEGIRGLYRGFGITIFTNSPAAALWWGSYGAAQHAIWKSLGYGHESSERKPGEMEVVWVQATAGTIAGASSSVLTTPLDTIKTRLQVMDGDGRRPPTLRNTVVKLVEEDGWRGLYRGFAPRFLNMSLWGTSMIVTYELIKRLSVKRD